MALNNINIININTISVLTIQNKQENSNYAMLFYKRKCKSSRLIEYMIGQGSVTNNTTVEKTNAKKFILTINIS